MWFVRPIAHKSLFIMLQVLQQRLREGRFEICVRLRWKPLQECLWDEEGLLWKTHLRGKYWIISPVSVVCKQTQIHQRTQKKDCDHWFDLHKRTHKYFGQNSASWFGIIKTQMTCQMRLNDKLYFYFKCSRTNHQIFSLKSAVEKSFPNFLETLILSLVWSGSAYFHQIWVLLQLKLRRSSRRREGARGWEMK